MGVLFLNSFIEAEFPTVFQEVNLAEIVQNYRKETKQEPVLLVDFATYVDCMSEPKVLGGLKQFKANCEKFIDAFRRLEIKLLVRHRGLREADIRTKAWRSRSKSKIGLIREGKHVANPCNNAFAYETLQEVAWEVLLSSKDCQCYRPLDSVQFVLNRARASGLFGILSKSTNYVFVEGFQYLLWAKNINLTDMTIQILNRNQLASSLEILPGQLPVFGSLCSNVDCNADFSKALYEKFGGNKFQNDANIEQIRTFFLKVAEFVRRLPPGGKLLDELKSHQKDLDFDDEQLEKFRTRLSLFLGMVPEEDIEKWLSGSDKWNNVLKLAREKYCTGHLENTLMEVLLFKCAWFQMKAENIRKNTIVGALSNLRRKLYGLLFFEYPGEVSVREYLCLLPDRQKKVKECERDVFFEKRSHPGLLSLWSANPKAEVQELKYRLFCQTVDENLDPDFLRSDLEEEFVFPLLAVFFMEETGMFLPLELDVLLAQSVLANKLSSIKNTKETDLEMDAIYLSESFLSAVNHVRLLNDVCGYPFSRESTSLVNFFEPALLHDVYRHANDTSNIKKCLTAETIAPFEHLKEKLKALKWIVAVRGETPE